MTSEPSPRFWTIFFELYEALPRQGPGSRASAERALSLCAELPTHPEVLDLGCGAGGQTLHLAELTGGTIVALDSHAPLVERLQKAALERGLSEQVQTVVADMDAPDFPPERFDLIWSEGALYNIGIARALELYHPLLREGGYLAFTDAVWRRDDAPDDVVASFAEYPGMGWVRDVLATIEASALELVSHFPLPDEDWWTDFYTPMEARIDELRGRYRQDAEALAILDELAKEPEMHRQHAGCFGYEFFVARRPSSPGDDVDDS